VPDIPPQSRDDAAVEARLQALLRAAAAEPAATGAVPDDEVVDAYLDGRATAAQVRAVRVAMHASRSFEAEVLALAELRRDLADGTLRRDLAAVVVPEGLGRETVVPGRSLAVRLRRWFWQPGPGYAVAAASLALVALLTARLGRDTGVVAPPSTPPAVVELVIPRHVVLRGEDEPLPVVVVPAAGDDVDLVVEAGPGAAPAETYQATLRQLDDNHILAYLALARRTPGDGMRLAMRVDRRFLVPGTAYAVVFTPRAGAEAGGPPREIVGRFAVSGP
jgi:hypothetical protein